MVSWIVATTSNCVNVVTPSDILQTKHTYIEEKMPPIEVDKARSTAGGGTTPSSLQQGSPPDHNIPLPTCTSIHPPAMDISLMMQTEPAEETTTYTSKYVGLRKDYINTQPLDEQPTYVPNEGILDTLSMDIGAQLDVMAPTRAGSDKAICEAGGLKLVDTTNLNESKGCDHLGQLEIPNTSNVANDITPDIQPPKHEEEVLPTIEPTQQVIAPPSDTLDPQEHQAVVGLYDWRPKHEVAPKPTSLTETILTISTLAHPTFVTDTSLCAQVEEPNKHASLCGQGLEYVDTPLFSQSVLSEDILDRAPSELPSVEDNILDAMASTGAGIDGATCGAGEENALETIHPVATLLIYLILLIVLFPFYFFNLTQGMLGAGRVETRASTDQNSFTDERRCDQKQPEVSIVSSVSGETPPAIQPPEHEDEVLPTIEPTQQVITLPPDTLDPQEHQTGDLEATASNELYDWRQDIESCLFAGEETLENNYSYIEPTHDVPSHQGTLMLDQIEIISESLTEATPTCSTQPTPTDHTETITTISTLAHPTLVMDTSLCAQVEEPNKHASLCGQGLEYVDTPLFSQSVLSEDILDRAPSELPSVEDNILDAMASTGAGIDGATCGAGEENALETIHPVATLLIYLILLIVLFPFYFFNLTQGMLGAGRVETRASTDQNSFTDERRCDQKQPEVSIVSSVSGETPPAIQPPKHEEEVLPTIEPTQQVITPPSDTLDPQEHQTGDLETSASNELYDWKMDIEHSVVEAESEGPTQMEEPHLQGGSTQHLYRVEIKDSVYQDFSMEGMRFDQGQVEASITSPISDETLPDIMSSKPEEEVLPTIEPTQQVITSPSDTLDPQEHQTGDLEATASNDWRKDLESCVFAGEETLEINYSYIEPTHDVPSHQGTLMRDQIEMISESLTETTCTCSTQPTPTAHTETITTISTLAHPTLVTDTSLCAQVEEPNKHASLCGQGLEYVDTPLFSQSVLSEGILDRAPSEVPSVEKNKFEGNIMAPTGGDKEDTVVEAERERPTEKEEPHLQGGSTPHLTEAIHSAEAKTSTDVTYLAGSVRGGRCDQGQPKVPNTAIIAGEVPPDIQTPWHEEGVIPTIEPIPNTLVHASTLPQSTSINQSACETSVTNDFKVLWIETTTSNCVNMVTSSDVLQMKHIYVELPLEVEDTVSGGTTPSSLQQGSPPDHNVPMPTSIYPLAMYNSLMMQAEPAEETNTHTSEYGGLQKEYIDMQPLDEQPTCVRSDTLSEGIEAQLDVMASGSDEATCEAGGLKLVDTGDFTNLNESKGCDHLGQPEIAITSNVASDIEPNIQPPKYEEEVLPTIEPTQQAISPPSDTMDPQEHQTGDLEVTTSNELYDWRQDIESRKILVHIASHEETSMKDQIGTTPETLTKTTPTCSTEATAITYTKFIPTAPTGATPTALTKATPTALTEATSIALTEATPTALTEATPTAHTESIATISTLAHPTLVMDISLCAQIEEPNKHASLCGQRLEYVDTPLFSQSVLSEDILKRTRSDISSMEKDNVEGKLDVMAPTGGDKEGTVIEAESERPTEMEEPHLQGGSTQQLYRVEIKDSAYQDFSMDGGRFDQGQAEVSITLPISDETLPGITSSNLEEEVLPTIEPTQQVIAPPSDTLDPQEHQTGDLEATASNELYDWRQNIESCLFAGEETLEINYSYIEPTHDVPSHQGTLMLDQIEMISESLTEATCTCSTQPIPTAHTETIMTISTLAHPMLVTDTSLCAQVEEPNKHASLCGQGLEYVDIPLFSQSVPSEGILVRTPSEVPSVEKDNVEGKLGVMAPGGDKEGTVVEAESERPIEKEEPHLQGGSTLHLTEAIHLAEAKTSTDVMHLAGSVGGGRCDQGQPKVPNTSIIAGEVPPDIQTPWHEEDVLPTIEPTPNTLVHTSSLPQSTSISLSACETSVTNDFKVLWIETTTSNCVNIVTSSDVLQMKHIYVELPLEVEDTVSGGTTPSSLQQGYPPDHNIHMPTSIYPLAMYNSLMMQAEPAEETNTHTSEYGGLQKEYIDMQPLDEQPTCVRSDTLSEGIGAQLDVMASGSDGATCEAGGLKLVDTGDFTDLNESKGCDRLGQPEIAITSNVASDITPNIQPPKHEEEVLPTIEPTQQVITLPSDTLDPQEHQTGDLEVAASNELYDWRKDIESRKILVHISSLEGTSMKDQIGITSESLTKTTPTCSTEATAITYTEYIPTAQTEATPTALTETTPIALTEASPTVLTEATPTAHTEIITTISALAHPTLVMDTSLCAQVEEPNKHASLCGQGLEYVDTPLFSQSVLSEGILDRAPSEVPSVEKDNVEGKLDVMAPTGGDKEGTAVEAESERPTEMEEPHLQGGSNQHLYRVEIKDSAYQDFSMDGVRFDQGQAEVSITLPIADETLPGIMSSKLEKEVILTVEPTQQVITSPSDTLDPQELQTGDLEATASNELYDWKMDIESCVFAGEETLENNYLYIEPTHDVPSHQGTLMLDQIEMILESLTEATCTCTCSTQPTPTDHIETIMTISHPTLVMDTSLCAQVEEPNKHASLCGQGLEYVDTPLFSQSVLSEGILDRAPSEVPSVEKDNVEGKLDVMAPTGGDKEDTVVEAERERPTEKEEPHLQGGSTPHLTEAIHSAEAKTSTDVTHLAGSMEGGRCDQEQPEVPNSSIIAGEVPHDIQKPRHEEDVLPIIEPPLHTLVDTSSLPQSTSISQSACETSATNNFMVLWIETTTSNYENMVTSSDVLQMKHIYVELPLEVDKAPGTVSGGTTPSSLRQGSPPDHNIPNPTSIYLLNSLMMQTEPAEETNTHTSEYGGFQKEYTDMQPLDEQPICVRSDTLSEGIGAQLDVMAPIGAGSDGAICEAGTNYSRDIACDIQPPKHEEEILPIIEPTRQVITPLSDTLDPLEHQTGDLEAAASNELYDWRKDIESRKMLVHIPSHEETSMKDQVGITYKTLTKTTPTCSTEATAINYTESIPTALTEATPTALTEATPTALTEATPTALTEATPTDHTETITTISTLAHPTLVTDTSLCAQVEEPNKHASLCGQGLEYVDTPLFSQSVLSEGILDRAPSEVPSVEKDNVEGKLDVMAPTAGDKEGTAVEAESERPTEMEEPHLQGGSNQHLYRVEIKDSAYQDFSMDGVRFDQGQAEASITLPIADETLPDIMSYNLEKEVIPTIEPTQQVFTSPSDTLDPQEHQTGDLEATASNELYDWRQDIESCVFAGEETLENNYSYIEPTHDVPSHQGTLMRDQIEIISESVTEATPTCSTQPTPTDHMETISTLAHPTLVTDTSLCAQVEEPNKHASLCGQGLEYVDTPLFSQSVLSEGILDRATSEVPSVEKGNVEERLDIVAPTGGDKEGTVVEAESERPAEKEEPHLQGGSTSHLTEAIHSAEAKTSTDVTYLAGSVGGGRCDQEQPKIPNTSIIAGEVPHDIQTPRHEEDVLPHKSHIQEQSSKGIDGIETTPNDISEFPSTHQPATLVQVEAPNKHTSEKEVYVDTQRLNEQPISVLSEGILDRTPSEVPSVEKDNVEGKLDVMTPTGGDKEDTVVEAESERPTDEEEPHLQGGSTPHLTEAIHSAEAKTSRNVTHLEGFIEERRCDQDLPEVPNTLNVANDIILDVQPHKHEKEVLPTIEPTQQVMTSPSDTLDPQEHQTVYEMPGPVNNDFIALGNEPTYSSGVKISTSSDILPKKHTYVREKMLPIEVDEAQSTVGDGTTPSSLQQGSAHDHNIPLPTSMYLLATDTSILMQTEPADHEETSTYTSECDALGLQKEYIDTQPLDEQLTSVPSEGILDRTPSKVPSVEKDNVEGKLDVLADICEADRTEKEQPHLQGGSTPHLTEAIHSAEVVMSTDVMHLYGPMEKIQMGRSGVALEEAENMQKTKERKPSDTEQCSGDVEEVKRQGAGDKRQCLAEVNQVVNALTELRRQTECTPHLQEGRYPAETSADVTLQSTSEGQHTTVFDVQIYLSVGDVIVPRVEGGPAEDCLRVVSTLQQPQVLDLGAEKTHELPSVMEVHVNIPTREKVTSGDDDKIHHPMKEANSLDEIGGINVHSGCTKDVVIGDKLKESQLQEQNTKGIAENETTTNCITVSPSAHQPATLVQVEAPNKHTSEKEVYVDTQRLNEQSTSVPSEGILDRAPSEVPSVEKDNVEGKLDVMAPTAGDKEGTVVEAESEGPTEKEEPHLQGGSTPHLTEAIHSVDGSMEKVRCDQEQPEVPNISNVAGGIPSDIQPPKLEEEILPTIEPTQQVITSPSDTLDPHEHQTGDLEAGSVCETLRPVSNDFIAFWIENTSSNGVEMLTSSDTLQTKHTYIEDKMLPIEVNKAQSTVGGGTTPSSLQQGSPPDHNIPLPTSIHPLAMDTSILTQTEPAEECRDQKEMCVDTQPLIKQPTSVPSEGILDRASSEVPSVEKDNVVGKLDVMAPTGGEKEGTVVEAESERPTEKEEPHLQGGSTPHLTEAIHSAEAKTCTDVTYLDGSMEEGRCDQGQPEVSIISNVFNITLSYPTDLNTTAAIGAHPSEKIQMARSGVAFEEAGSMHKTKERKPTDTEQCSGDVEEVKRQGAGDKRQRLAEVNQVVNALTEPRLQTEGTPHLQEGIYPAETSADVTLQSTFEGQHTTVFDVQIDRSVGGDVIVPRVEDGPAEDLLRVVPTLHQPQVADLGAEKLHEVPSVVDVHVNIPIGGKVTSGDDDKIHHPMKETNSLDELGSLAKDTAMLSIEKKVAVSEAVRGGSSQRPVDLPDPTEHAGMEPEGDPTSLNTNEFNWRRWRVIRRKKAVPKEHDDEKEELPPRPRPHSGAIEKNVSIHEPATQLRPHSVAIEINVSLPHKPTSQLQPHSAALELSSEDIPVVPGSHATRTAEVARTSKTLPSKPAAAEEEKTKSGFLRRKGAVRNVSQRTKDHK